MSERELPEGWVETTIEEVVTLNPKIECTDDTDVGFTPMNLVGTSFYDKVGFYIRKWKDVKKGYTSFQNGDLLLAKITPCFENGKSGIVQNLPNNVGAGSTEFFVSRPKHEILNGHYLFSWFKTRDFMLQAETNMSGSVGQKRVPKSWLLQSSLPLPPLPEQKRIVAKLDTILGKLGECQARLDRVPALLRRFRQSVLAAATSGKLTEEWREENKNLVDAHKLLEIMQKEKLSLLGKKFKAGNETILNKELDVELFDLPKSWAWTTFEKCAWEITVGHVGPMSTKYLADGIPFLRSQNVRPLKYQSLGLTFIDEQFDSEISKSSLKGGEILVVRSGANTGDSCVYPRNNGIANCADLVITRPLSGLLAEYGVAFIESPFGQAQLLSKQTGVAQPHFNVGAMKVKPFPLPPLPEQQEIVHRMESLLALADRIETRYHEAKTQIDRLQPALLAKAFRGELVLQDPADEPASVLLERIKALSGTLEGENRGRKVTTSRRGL